MIRALIIDDEADARVSLQLLLQKFCPEVQILELCPDPLRGLEAIAAYDPDLIFLDVQMPRMSGFDLLEKIPAPRFQTIFVTAHDHYAIKAIRFSALDYLLKPVEVDELVSAVSRAREQQTQQTTMPYPEVIHNVKNRLGKEGKLAVPTAEGMAFIELKHLLYCEADGSYTQLVIRDKKPMLVSKKLKEIEQILDPAHFCRVHHSSLINLDHVERYVKGEGGYVIMSDGQQVNISRRKKEEFMRLIDRL
ncbi:MAG: LytTR family DNA-binding domain-containing protein [Bacteroidota bacterium]